MTNPSKPTFAPQLYIPSGTFDVSFYEKALGAKELRRFSNDDGSIHVVEFSIGDAMFHLHEETPRLHLYAPIQKDFSTVIIGLFVPDVDAVMESAIAAGAKVISPAQDYDYGYRQGEVRDPFGHVWMIEKRI